MSYFRRTAAVESALQHLRDAREDLKDAGSTRAVDRVRAAIRSAEGARRHADRMDRNELIEARRNTDAAAFDDANSLED